VILGQEIIYTFAMFISKNMDDQNLSDEQFKRRFGVYKQTYRKMVESVKSVEADSNSGLLKKFFLVAGCGVWGFTHFQVVNYLIFRKKVPEFSPRSLQ